MELPRFDLSRRQPKSFCWTFEKHPPITPQFDPMSDIETPWQKPAANRNQHSNNPISNNQNLNKENSNDDTSNMTDQLFVFVTIPLNLDPEPFLLPDLDTKTPNKT